jgi:hypothetical protein
MSIKVYPSLLNKPDNKLKLIDENKMIPPFRTVITGPTTCGKSNFTKNILFNKQWKYCKYFDEIYVFCGSKDDLLEYKQWALKENIDKKFKFMDKYDDQAVKELIDSIEQDNIKRKNPSRVLIVLDDQICNGVSKAGKLNAVDEIFIRGRHANISVIITTQKYKSLSNNMRVLNASNVVVFNGTNSNDMEAIANEHANTLSKDDALKLLKDNLNKPYSFVMINYKKPPNERFQGTDFKNITTSNSEPVKEHLGEVEENNKEDE